MTNKFERYMLPCHLCDHVIIAKDRWEAVEAAKTFGWVPIDQYEWLCQAGHPRD